MGQPKAELEILNGWKEIANHLGKGVRTVQRYERILALPIRRPAGRRGGSVIATKAELDAWVSASPVQQSFPVSTAISNQTAVLQEFRLRIAEMRRLRHETLQLQAQLRRACELLEVSLRTVLPRETRLAQSSLPLGRTLTDVLTFDSNKRTVS
jgi:hypothetical protein